LALSGESSGTMVLITGSPVNFVIAA